MQLDRIIATKWIKKLTESDNDSNRNVRDHYLKLLLISLQRKKLVGPFAEIPTTDELSLDATKINYQPGDISKLILEEEYKLKGTPPYIVETTADLSEYAVYQEIPNFGAHFYYAYSPDPLPKWSNFEKAILPKGTLAVNIAACPDTSIIAKMERDAKLAVVPYVPPPIPLVPKVIPKPQSPKKVTKKAPEQRSPGLGRSLLEESYRSGIVKDTDLNIEQGPM